VAVHPRTLAPFQWMSNVGEHAKCVTIAVVDTLVGDRGHQIRDGLLMVEALLEAGVSVHGYSSGNGVRAFSDVSSPRLSSTVLSAPPAFLCRVFGLRFSSVWKVLFAAGLKEANGVVFVSTEEISILLFRLLNPRIPIFICLTNNLAGNVRRPVKRLLIVAALRSVDGIGVFSQYDAVVARRLLPGAESKVRHLPYAPLGIVRAVAPFGERRKAVVMIGHQTVEKGFDRFYALAAADAAGTFAFEAVGHGLAVPQPIPGLTVRSGFVPEGEYWELLSTATYVLLPYGRTYEGKLSGIFVDAIRCGTPVVAPDIEPFRDFFLRFGPLGILADFDDLESVVNLDDWPPSLDRFTQFQESAARAVTQFRPERVRRLIAGEILRTFRVKGLRL
jgi:glycosyltransferase involved in cell wall biosynthesis